MIATDPQAREGKRLTIRYGIRWDGRGRPKPARMAALGLAALAFLLPASARADDSGDAAATASMERVSGGSGLAAGAPDGTGVDVALIDSGVVPVGGLAEPGRVDPRPRLLVGAAANRGSRRSTPSATAPTWPA